MIRAALEAGRDSRGGTGSAVAALNPLVGGRASYAVRTEPHIDNPEQP